MNLTNAVHFDLKSRAWLKDNVHQLNKDGEKAYFLEVRAWKVESAVAENATPQAEPQGEAPPEQPPQDFSPNPPQDDNGPDDLPF